MCWPRAREHAAGMGRNWRPADAKPPILGRVPSVLSQGNDPCEREAAGLDGVDRGRQLPPVAEHEHGGAGLGDAEAFADPELTPVPEAALVPAVAAEAGVIRAARPHDVLVRGRLLARAEVEAAAAVGRVRDDGVDAVAGQLAEVSERFAFDQFPGREVVVVGGFVHLAG